MRELQLTVVTTADTPKNVLQTGCYKIVTADRTILFVAYLCTLCQQQLTRKKEV